MNDRQRLRDRVNLQAERRDQAERDQSTLLSRSVFIGTLGCLLVLPVVAGAYLGLWLDGLLEGYSVRWTVSMILLGVLVGAVNVYLFIREKY